MSEKPNGIILAGGKSSRMGAEKGLLKINGTPMIELAIRALEPVVSNILIISANSNYLYLGRPLYPDRIEDCGPSGGIYTGLLHSSTDMNIVLSCDTPNITSAFLEYLILHAAEEDVLVPVSLGTKHPLSAVYKKGMQEKLMACIAAGEKKMTTLLGQFRVNYLDMDKQTQFDSEILFRNINTPEELQTENNRH